jgi:competence protein ComEC
MNTVAPQHHSTASAGVAAASPCRRVSASELLPRRQPFFYLTVALTAGILADRRLGPAPLLVIVIAIASVIFSLIFIARKKCAPATVALLVSFAAVGALLSFNDRTHVEQSRLKQMFDAGVITANDPVELTGVLVAPPEPAEMQGRPARYLDLDAESVRIRDDTLPATGRARLLIMLEDEQSKNEYEKLAPDYGSRLRVIVRLERARSYANPGSVDFNDFLERQGYDLKGTVKSTLLVENLGSARSNPSLAFLYRLRLRLMDAIDSTFDRREAGTLKAMIAGSRYFIDPETAERLREGATFHTLVISGFHVGIIAWALLRLRIPRRRSRQPEFQRPALTRTIIALVALWAYTVMVGLTPPVTRATVMITFGLIAPLLFRRAASINTVSLAAFAMLALEPALVADPAFQLSYVAVAAIVGLALPLIGRLREIGRWRPTSRTPHPPSCSPRLRLFAESLFWDERGFEEEMRRSPIRYRLHKAKAARVLGRVHLQWLVRGVVTLTITSAAIQVATLPLMAAYFNRVAPVGILLNITASLLTAALMLFALAAMILSAVFMPIAALLKSIVGGAHYLLAGAVVPFAEIPGATFRVAHYEGWPAIIYALYFAPVIALAVLIDRWRPVARRVADKWNAERVTMSDEQRDKSSLNSSFVVARSTFLKTGHQSLWFCLIALLVFIIAVIRPVTGEASGKLVVHFLDVGQGDSALVIFPQGATMLVDAGGIGYGRQWSTATRSETDGADAATVFNNSGFSIGESVVSRFLWSQGRTSIDYALVTHPHSDHMEGFSDVIKNFHVGQAIAGHIVAADDDEFAHFAARLSKRRFNLAQVAAGERFEIQGVVIEVLGPQHATVPEGASGNDESVVLRLIYGSTSILLAGDVEQRAEDALVRSGVDLKADVLKVPHHGSKTSSSEAFIESVEPRLAIISVGERSHFGHPHDVVVNRYLTRGAQLLQTGRDGMITVESDGATFNVSADRRTKEK